MITPFGYHEHQGPSHTVLRSWDTGMSGKTWSLQETGQKSDGFFKLIEYYLGEHPTRGGGQGISRASLRTTRLRKTNTDYTKG